MYEFQAKFGKEEIKALNSFHTFNKQRWLIILLTIIFFFYFLINYLETKNVIYLVVAVIFGSGFPLLTYVIMRLMVNSYLRSTKMVSDESNMNFKFTDEAIDIKMEKPDMTSTTSMKWNLLFRAYENKSHYFLYISNRQSYIIPKISIKIGTNEDFSRYLKEKLGKNFIVRK
jgi:hypothetical protein